MRCFNGMTYHSIPELTSVGLLRVQAALSEFDGEITTIRIKFNKALPLKKSVVKSLQMHIQKEQ